MHSLVLGLFTLVRFVHRVRCVSRLRMSYVIIFILFSGDNVKKKISGINKELGVHVFLPF
jgi:hypothetical protein